MKKEHLWNLRDARTQRKFKVRWHHVGKHVLSLGLTIDWKGPFMEIHFGWGFLQLGWLWKKHYSNGGYDGYTLDGPMFSKFKPDEPTITGPLQLPEAQEVSFSSSVWRLPESSLAKSDICESDCRICGKQIGWQYWGFYADGVAHSDCIKNALMRE